MKYILIAMIIGTSTSGQPVSKIKGLGMFTDGTTCVQTVDGVKAQMLQSMEEQDWVGGGGKYVITYVDAFCRQVPMGKGV